MSDPVTKDYREVRMVYNQGLEARMAYYDSLLRGTMDLIEKTMKIMKTDGMPEVVDDLGNALLAIEDAWTALTLQRTSPLIPSEGEREPRGLEGE